MSDRDSENFDLEEELLSGSTEDSGDYDRLLDRVDTRRAHPGTRSKAAWSQLEDILADRRLEKDLRDFDEEL